MDMTQLYRIVDVESPDEFKYYDNMSALLESEEYIETEDIAELLFEIDLEILEETMDTFFEEYLTHIPDEESDLYILIEEIKRVMMGRITNLNSEDAAYMLAEEINRFRKWYVLDTNAFDLKSGYEVTMMDARYNIASSKFTGEEFKYDYSTAYDYEFDGYDVAVSDMIMKENDID